MAEKSQGVHHCELSSPLTIHIESALDSRLIGNAWIYRPQTLHNSANPPNLRHSKEGFPLLRSDEFRTGDVGVLRPDGFFNYLFNITFPKNHPLNVGGVPEFFEPVQSAHTTDGSKVNSFRTGYMAKNSMQPEVQTMNTHVESLRNSDTKHEDSASAYSDRCAGSSPENKGVFRQYATQNAHRWFNYVENALEYINGSQNLSICLITGSSQVPADPLAHSFTENTTLNSKRPPYQSAFVCGFKITKRQGFKEKAPANHEGCTLNNGHDSCPRTSTSVDGSSLIASAHISSTAYTPDLQHKETANLYYHPCDMINGFMLELLSSIPNSVGNGPLIAVSHNDDWQSVWDEDITELPIEQELIRRLCSSSSFIIDNGTIYPSPLDGAITPSSPNEDLVARVIVLLACPVGRCGERFQQQSTLISHMQQNHSVVHGTSARVPLSAAAASTGVSQRRETKRTGGITALSCAECRRLKIKCSRTFPCTNCIRKGCAAICPDDRLTKGKGSRFVLANTHELQNKIAELTDRAKVLEDALAKSYSIVSSQPHPLLSDDLLQRQLPRKTKSPETGLSDPVTPRPEGGEEREKENDEALIVYNASLGSLHVDDERNAFYGRSSSSWHFLLNEKQLDRRKQSWSLIQPPLPIHLTWLVYSFPFSAPVDVDTVQKLIGLLPKISVARRHYQNYYRYGAWQHTPISEVEFMTTIFQPWYEPIHTQYNDPLGAHRLSILFIILALGCLLDPEGQSHLPEARWYYHLAKASLALEPVLESQSLSTIQALLLMMYYMLLDNIHDSRYPIMGLVTKLAHAMGLHLDGTHYGLPLEETHHRRILSWEVYCHDILMCLSYGRPPSSSVHHIDTKMPFEATRDANGNIEMTYTAWKHKFIGDCLGPIFDKAFGAHPLSYDLLKRLDQRMRTYYVPPSLRLSGFGGVIWDQDVQPEHSIGSEENLIMTRHFAIGLKEMTSFYMHRGFFAIAINEAPDNPLKHRYGESVQTIYDSACILIGIMRSLYKHQPQMRRFSNFFDQTLSCAYVLGSIASKPQVNLALSALTNLELTYDLFDATLYDTPRRTRILAEINTLREQARSALKVTQNPLDEMQKLVRPKNARKDSVKADQSLKQKSHPSWPAQVPTGPVLSHQYPPTVIQPATHDTSQNSLHPSSGAAYQIQQQPFNQPQYCDPFFEHPLMAYNPITGYQYYDYQDPGYFQQQMERETGDDASGDVYLPVLDESWQDFMNQIRQ